MDSGPKNEIVAGITVDPSGQAKVDKVAGELLFDLALQLEDSVSAPVDVEHVLAAIVLAARAGQVDSTTPLCKDNHDLLDILSVHLQVVFDTYGGALGRDDD